MVQILYAWYTKWFQKFPKFESRAGAGFSTDKWCLVALSACILSIYLFFGACIILLFFPLKLRAWRSSVFASSFISNLAGMWQKLQKWEEKKKKTFGDDALAQSQICNWFNRFKNGRMSHDDDGRSRWTSIGTMVENVAKVREVIREDHGRTIHDACSIVGLS